MRFPYHWPTIRLGYVARIGNGSTPSRSNIGYWNGGTFPWLSSGVVNDGIVTHANEAVTELALKECHLPVVFPNSVLVAITGEGKTRGMAALLKIEATINQHLAFIVPDSDVLRPAFLHKALMGRYQELRQDSSNQGSTRSAITCFDLANLRVAVPPLNQQDAIVRFLEEKEREIERYLTTKRRMIEALEERREALVDVVFRPSTTSHTSSPTLVTLRRLTEVIDCKHVTAEFLDHGFPLASVREVQSITVDLSTARRTSAKYFATLTEGGRRPMIGDVVFCRNTSINASLVDTAEEFAMGQDVCLIKGDRLCGRYLVYALRSSIVREQLDCLLVGATIKRINVANVRNLAIPSCGVDEQRQIAQRIDDQVAPLEAARDVINREITVMEEYRTCLIADAVTGQIDVRRAT